LDYLTSSQKSIINIWRQLLQAGDQFIVYRESNCGTTVIMDIPGSMIGDAILIALPGLALTTQRFDLAKAC